MTITFLVGNGFDIAAGLNTSYSGFYEWYRKQPPRTDDKHGAIKAFKEEIDNYMDIKDPEERKKSHWADFEVGLGKYTAKFTIDTADDFIELYEDAHEGIVTYLENERSKYEAPLSDPKIIDRFREGIRGFFGELNPTERGTFTQLFQNDQPHNTEIQFVSFNYTDCLDVCVKEVSKQSLSTWQYNGSAHAMSVTPSVIHAHGMINHYPILGVFDESQIENKDLLAHPGFAEVMIKSQGIRAMGEYWYSETEKSINNSKVVCVWGMSLGETDAYWWKKIITWLKEVADRHLVIFWHTKNPPNQISIFRSIRGKRDVVNLLASFSNLSEDEINTIKNRIHVVFNTERVLRISFSKVAPKALPDSGTLAAMKEIVDEMMTEGQLTTV